MKYFAGYVRAQQIEHPEVNIVGVSTGLDSYIDSTVTHQYGEMVFVGNQTCEYCGTIGLAGAV